MLAGTLAAIGAYYTHKSFGLNRETLELSRLGPKLLSSELSRERTCVQPARWPA
jgi:hypothetical protein